jgi:hypothetical protein
MKQLSRTPVWTAMALFLTLPTAYFIFSGLLKFEWNLNGPFDAITPFLERTGYQEPIGWNINLLILFGPIAGLLICIFQVLSIRFENNTEKIGVNIRIRKHWFPLLVAAFSIGLLGLIAIYMAVENCSC